MAAPARTLRDRAFDLLEAQAWTDVSLFDSTPERAEGAEDRRVWMGGYSVDHTYHSLRGRRGPTVDSDITLRVNCDVADDDGTSKAVSDACADLTDRIHTAFREAITDRYDWQVGRRIRPAVSGVELGESEPLKKGGWVCTAVLFIQFDVNTNPPAA